MRDDLPRGALLAVTAAAAFAVMGACIKAASAHSGTPMVVFFRSATSLLLLLPWMLRPGKDLLRTQRLQGHLWRAALGLGAMYAFFYALAHLELAVALLLTYTTPLYLPFLAWAGLGERPAAVTFLAALLGLLGIALVLQPATGFLEGAALAGLLSGVLAAGAMVSLRRLSTTEPALRIVFYFALFSTLASGLPLVWVWRTPDLPTLALLLATGLFATLGQLFLTQAYGLAPAARVGPFTYTSVVFAGLLGWLLWDEALNALALVGVAVVIASCLLCLTRAAGRGAAA